MSSCGYHDGDFQINYTYSKENGEGFLDNRGLSVWVDTTTLSNDHNLDKEIYERLVHVKHKSMLKCMFIDYKNKNIVYEPFLSTLKNPPLTYDPLLTYVIPSYDPDPIQYNYISETYRTMFRDMISFVCYLHRHKLCLESLSVDNLVLANEKLKFYHLRLVPKSDALEINDFKQTADVITSLLQLKGCGPAQIPEDLKNFIKCLRDFDPKHTYLNVESQEYFFQNHIAILSSEKRIARIEAYGSTVQQYEYDLSPLFHSLHLGRNWMPKFNSMKWGPVKDVLKVERVGDSPEYNSSPKSFLLFGLNLSKHLEKNIKEYKPMCNRLDVELCMMAAMGAQVSNFERTVFNETMFRALAG